MALNDSQMCSSWKWTLDGLIAEAPQSVLIPVVHQTWMQPILNPPDDATVDWKLKITGSP